jgi:predicted transcriptional regulator
MIMNVGEAAKLQEGTSTREEAVFQLAKTKAREEKKYWPVIIELNDTTIGRWCVAGWDTFDLKVDDIVEGGRARQRRILDIKDRFAIFVDRPEYEGLTKVIPTTEQNLQLLATAHKEKRYTIHDERVAEEVERRAALIKPIRDSAREAAQPDFMGHQDPVEDQLKIQVKELQRQLKEKELLLGNMPTTGELNGQPAKPYEPQPAASVVADTQIKEKVKEKHKEEIAQMKARGIKRVDMTKEFKEWMAEENVHNEPNS